MILYKKKINKSKYIKKLKKNFNLKFLETFKKLILLKTFFINHYNNKYKS